MARRNKSSETDAVFQKALYDAARLLNWFLPQTEEEVASSEGQVDASDYENRGNPFEALDRDVRFSKRPSAAAPAADEYKHELSRAARLGRGRISEEIEERMRRDRERAETRDGD